MAPARRRSNRKKGNAVAATQQSQSPPMDDSDSENLSVANPTPGSLAHNKDACPACKATSTPLKEGAHRDTWIRCDACRKWFHWVCVGEENQDHEAVGNWFCKPCRDEDSSRIITFKPPARKSMRKKAQRDYASLHAGLEADPDKWVKLIETKTISEDRFMRMNGSDVSLDWLNSNEEALLEPIVIETPDGLGMTMPDQNFEVRTVMEILGADTPVEVIGKYFDYPVLSIATEASNADVNTQLNVPNWNLEKWTVYYYTEPRLRDKIRNVISLEVSNTDLASRVAPPRIFRELDWVENFWPPNKRGKGQQYPKVQLYCLMGVARAWTDWHVDFAGSSVYYHILRGAKTFYFIRPTASNLNAYEKWSGSETQNHVWLGDMVDEVIKVELHQGNTMIIPTGWIHAVHTPEDSLVFGGNFLHSYNVATQLRVREIEIATQVPKKFRFPFFAKLCWYVGEKYLRDLKAKEEFPMRVLESIEALAQFLVTEVRTMERGNESGKREAKDMVPADKVKDAPSLARELRWRIRLAMGHGSGDEGRTKGRQPTMLNGINKRKRENGGRSHSPEQASGMQNYKHFKPRDWDVERRVPGGLSFVRRKVPRPLGETASEGWMEWDDEVYHNGAKDDGQPDTEDEAEVEVKKDVTIRARQFVKQGVLYIERHRAERMLEVWRWHDGDKHEDGVPQDVPSMGLVPKEEPGPN